MALWKQVLFLLLLGGLGYGGFEAYLRYWVVADPRPATSDAAQAAVVEIALAERREIRETIEAVGSTRALQSIDIVPESSGRIVDLAITPGQHVTAGTVLLRLDDVIARADLDQANARLVERTKAVERTTKLRRTNAVAESALEEAVRGLAEAQAELDRARQRFSERTIRAPFAGVVGLSEVDRGARVSEGTFITRLDDLSQVEIEFSLPETLFARVRIGQVVAAGSAAFAGRDFGGRIEAIDNRIDPLSRSFRVRAVLPNPDGILPAGMFMSLDLTLSRAEFTVVPEEAVILEAAESYVFVVADGVAHRVRVRTGGRRDGVVTVLEGVAPGQEVVIRGLHRVRDGAAVTLLGAPDTGTDS